MAKPMINVDLIWPVQSLYLTTDKNFNPNTAWGGTWARLGGDAYLKNVPAVLESTQPIGNYGGTTTNHTIPVSSMPSHNHGVQYLKQQAGNDYQFAAGVGAWQTTGATNYNIMYTGGGEPYYPYYYGIIVWKRTA